MIPPVAILPSLDEPDTIGDVVAAVDTALDNEHALIVHADASPDRATADAFRAVATRARVCCLTGLPAGKGVQILAALHEADPRGAVLVADTDTRNPDPATYRALLDQVTGARPASIALADYLRHWDEANLTNHLARLLIAATTGYDVPQPLAGDIALAPASIAAIDAALAALPADLADRVGGYGIDAFLLHTAATTGPVTSVPLTATKLHAPSFPHLPTIFAQAVPVLLHPAASHPAQQPRIGTFRVADRDLPGIRRTAMLDTLHRLRPQPSRYDDRSWSAAVATSWHAVAAGASPVDAADQLWPAYLDRVRAWLTSATSAAQRARELEVTATTLLATLAAHPTATTSNNLAKDQP